MAFPPLPSPGNTAWYPWAQAVEQAASSVTVLAGDGIDPTGVADSTVVVQAILDSVADGSTVIVPGGTIINLTGTITVAHRIRLTGAGELRWTAGIANSAMLDVTVDGCHFDGVHLTNPNHLAAQTGNRTSGIHFQANSGRVSNCRIVGQQQAICVEANGEWHDFTITGNLILDAPGSGDGPTNTTSAYGEDRGDGITVWGATATITGNRVAALAGTDARVGIHVEALPGSETTSYAHADSLCVITGNIVTGKFRRGITSEGVSHTTITGNAVTDSTWWGISLINTAHRSSIVGNTIKWTRTGSDNQGAAWSPVRSGVMVYDNASDCVITGNTIRAATGAAMPHGITLQKGTVAGARMLITGNLINAADSNITNAINIPNGFDGVTVRGNSCYGFTNVGVYAASVDDFHVRDNQFIGTSASYGVQTTGTNSAATIIGNLIQSCSVAVALYFRTVLQVVSGNTIVSASTGIDLFNSSGTAQVSNNLFQSVTTKTQNLPTGTITVGNN